MTLHLEHLEPANGVLETFTRNLTFVLGDTRCRSRSSRKDLCLRYMRPGNRPHVVRAEVNRQNGSLIINYGKLGLGGTKAVAVAQLALWIRGRPRLPLTVWRYWAGDTILLARERGPEMLERIEASMYDDAKSTLCVLCGCAPKGGLDWWCRGEVSGPCCALETCLRTEAALSKCDGSDDAGI